MIRTHSSQWLRASQWLRGVFMPMALLALIGNHAYAAPSVTVALTASAQNVTAGTVVTLTGTVTSGANNTPYPNGYVSFCDATAAYCDNAALLGFSEVGSAGTATLKIKLGIGVHSIEAAYGHRPGKATILSAPVTITVTGQSPTATLLSTSGSSLNATVGYLGLATVPAGESVSFADSTNNNLQLGTATLGAAAAPLFGFINGSGSPFNGGALPVALVTGDFNNDGTPDLAVANYLANTVQVYAGSGSGFTPLGSAIAVGNGPVAIYVADVNRDGFADLLVANANDATITVLLGDGTGAFSLASTVSTGGSGPSSLAVFDTNSDGWPDIVVVNQLSSTLAVLIGDGTGNFSAVNAAVATGGNPSAIVAADFNGDGIEDVAFTNSYDGTVSVWLGQGDGTFQPMAGSPFAVPPPASAASIPSSLTVGDFDGDGRPDLAIADAVNNRVSILLNPASGMVFTSSSSTTGASPASIVVGDFNGDGKADLAIANANDSTITLLQGDGTGNFSASAQSPLTNFNAAQAIAVLDFNGDGLQDLAAANVGNASVSLRQQTVVQDAIASLSPFTVYGGGSHLLEASYEGDSGYTSSSSNTISVTGSLIATTGALSASPGSTVAYGTTAQFTETITPESAYNYTATGTVTFKDGATTIGTANLSNGQAVVSANSLAIGSHTIVATYSGDANFSANTSATLSFAVGKSSSTTALSSSANPVLVTGPVTFTAAVSSSATGSPTGSVSFYDGTTLLGAVTLQSGQAAYTTSSLAAGTHSITATYSGDATNNTSSSTAVSEVVQDFTIAPGGGSSGSGSTPSQTVSPGGTATYQLDFGATTNAVFPDPITLSVSGLPPGATATLSPQSLPAGSTLGNVTLTIQVPQTSAQLKYDRFLGRAIAPVALGLLLLPFSSRIRRTARRLGRTATMLAILLGSFAGFVGLSGCGGGSSHQAQTYVITITATSGSLSHSTTVNLIVN